ncbi:hypothetical protein [Parasphingorhabdus sp.]|uniref:hypothetical protein n=1 Tax=Parasphingorhabdus sp. TaxID=2709688 RepID=UPI003D26C315
MLCFIERQLPGDSDQSSFGEWLKAGGKRTFGSFDLKGAFWADCGLSGHGSTGKNSRPSDLNPQAVDGLAVAALIVWPL